MGGYWVFWGLFGFIGGFGRWDWNGSKGRIVGVYFLLMFYKSLLLDVLGIQVLSKHRSLDSIAPSLSAALGWLLRASIATSRRHGSSRRLESLNLISQPCPVFI